TDQILCMLNTKHRLQDSNYGLRQKAKIIALQPPYLFSSQKETLRSEDALNKLKANGIDIRPVIGVVEIEHKEIRMFIFFYPAQHPTHDMAFPILAGTVRRN